MKSTILMPCDLIVDAQLRVVHSRYFGDVTLDDVLGQREQMMQHPDFEPGFSLVIDLSEAGHISLSAADVRRIAKSPTPPGVSSRHIFVAPRADMYGIARMYQAYGEAVQRDVVVVRSMEEAKRLL
jgi:hypothetical protein